MPVYYKRKIEEDWGCKIIIDYGSAECMRIAFQCSEGNLHFDAYRYYLRKANALSNQQKVLITNLNNFVFPFINYDLGDYIRLSHKECGCGCNFPLIEKVLGRNTDYVISKDGIKYSNSIFTVIFEHHFSNINRYQIIQRSGDEVDIKIVENFPFQEELFKEFIDKLNSITNNNFVFKIKKVKEIKPQSNGKYRVIIPMEDS